MSTTGRALVILMEAGLMAASYAAGYMVAVPILTKLTDRIDARLRLSMVLLLLYALTVPADSGALTARRRGDRCSGRTWERTRVDGGVPGHGRWYPVPASAFVVVEACESKRVIFMHRYVVGALLVFFCGAVTAQHSQPYAGQHERSIKALSDTEVQQYLAGAGMGYARAAELNGYPGPMHVLELAVKLGLSEQQRAATSKLMESHKAEAKALGAKRVEAEKELEVLFLGKPIDEAALAAGVRKAALADGDYRLSHLETHRRMRDLLSDQQVRQYDVLRGYAGHKH